MKSTKIIIALGLITIGQFYYTIFERKIQGNDNVGTIKMSYAECREGILAFDLTIALSIASRMEVVHSFKEAKAFLKRAKGKSKVMVMYPNATRMKMDETFCTKSQTDKDRALLAAVQTELLD